MAYIGEHKPKVTHPVLAEALLNTPHPDDDGSVQMLNLQRYETEIARIADLVVLFLESMSVAAELGAFAMSDELAKKLLVVNDSRYMRGESFIDQGPLAIVRESGQHRVVYSDPRTVTRSFIPIVEEIDRVRESPMRPVEFESLSSNIAQRAHIDVLHDIIYLLQPIGYKELSDVWKGILLTARPDINRLLRFLFLNGTVMSCSATKMYSSLRGSPYFAMDERALAVLRSQRVSAVLKYHPNWIDIRLSDKR